MTSTWRALRRKILTPNVSATRLEERGFHVKNDEARELLETVGRSFISGFSYAAGSRTPADAEVELETVPFRFRGFAYEGAGMGFTIMDALGMGGGHCIDRFIAGRGGQHIYMLYIGVGWALARVPRFRWRAVIPNDPLLRWLALDGYGFHQAYFQTDKYVYGQYQNPRFPWPGETPTPYANRGIDQGIGRALWFVEGTDVDRVVTVIEKFPAERHADLFSGAGLAATYAGGVTEAELREFWNRVGEHRPMVAQACAFAAKARVLAGLVTPHTELACSVFCATTPADAAKVTDDALVDLPPDGDVPAFEVWRQRIADEFAARGCR